MAVQFIAYAKCTTCRKAKKWLEENGVPFVERPIQAQRPTAEELRDWQRRSGLPLRKFFNTSGMKYRELQLKDRLPRMTDGEMIDLLSSDGMLVKRPLLITDRAAVPGFREEEWRRALADR